LTDKVQNFTYPYHGRQILVRKISNEIMEWFCGYVYLNEKDSLYQKHYQDCNFPNFNVYGGITYTGKLDFKAPIWLIGFDTNHFNSKFTLKETQIETEFLADQIIDYEVSWKALFRKFMKKFWRNKN